MESTVIKSEKFLHSFAPSYKTVFALKASKTEFPPKFGGLKGCHGAVMFDYDEMIAFE